MSFSLLNPTIKDGKHSSGKILNYLILRKKQTQETEEKFRCLYPVLKTIDKLAEICKRFKNIKGMQCIPFPQGTLIY